MATLERVMQMKEEGISNPNIIQTLRQEGISPKEIDEALSQSEIKYAVNGSEEGKMPEGEQMEQDMQQENNENYSGEGYSRSSFQESSEGDTGVIDPGVEQQPGMAQEYYPEYNAPQSGYQEYQAQQPVDIETINEMVEQAIEEKTDTLKKQVSSFTKFKEDTGIELEKLSARLKKIEDTIDELQISILRRVGEYGKNVESIAKEMHATQDTFSKIIDPLTDNIRELRELTEGMKPEQNETGIVKSQIPQEIVPENNQNTEERNRRVRPDFENFLR